jgi:hypothetical protein
MPSDSRFDIAAGLPRSTQATKYRSPLSVGDYMATASCRNCQGLSEAKVARA